LPEKFKSIDYLVVNISIKKKFGKYFLKNYFTLGKQKYQCDSLKKNKKQTTTYEIQTLLIPKKLTLEKKIRCRPE
jgi:hypothetical protein